MKISLKVLCIIACLIIGCSVFLPYFSVSGFGITISKSIKSGGDWILILIIATAAFVFSLLGKYLPVVLLGMASFGLFFWESNSFTTSLGKEIDALARSMITNDLGYYFLLVGSIVLIIFSVFGLAGKKWE